jgi:DNA-binding XRE family transcriptional regulator
METARCAAALSSAGRSGAARSTAGRPAAARPAAARSGTAGGAIGPLIRRYRAARGLTQRELARAAGVSIGALRDVEQGRTRWPRWPAFESMAAALGLDQRPPPSSR